MIVPGILLRQLCFWILHVRENVGQHCQHPLEFLPGHSSTLHRLSSSSRAAADRLHPVPPAAVGLMLQFVSLDELRRMDSGNAPSWRTPSIRRRVNLANAGIQCVPGALRGECA